MINIPQNQCFLNLVLLSPVSMYTPERKINPEKMKDAIPNPRRMKKSLNHAPNLLAQFSVLTSLEVKLSKAL